MLKTIAIANLSAKNTAPHVKEARTNPELLLALRRQRLEERLEILEPCLFKYTKLLTKKYYNLAKDEENPSSTATDPHYSQPIPLSVKLQA